MTRASARLQFVAMLGVLALAASAWPVAQVVQQPPGAPQQTVGTGFISGQVIEIPSGRPVPEARVSLIGRGVLPPGQPVGRGSVQQQTVITDPQGRFYFSRLPNGSYSLSAQKLLYTGAAGPAIELSDAERMTDVRLRLSPYAAIAGTVRDTAGDPVVGTAVVAFRRTYATGKPIWVQFSRDVTDDRGEYRVAGLPAADYIVCACTRDPIPFDGQLLKTIAAEPLGLLSVAGRALTVGADVVSLDSTLKTFAPKFHPNSASAARAERIALTPGEEKTGVDVSLDLVRATRVSGRIVGAQGPVQASSVRLVPAADADAGIYVVTQIQPMLVQADGRFDFAPVPPGQYRIVVTHREVTGAGPGGPSGIAMGFVGPRGTPPATPMRMGGAGPIDPLLWANEPISVGESGVSGFSVALSSAVSIRGRLQYVGAAPQPPAQQFQRISVSLSAVDPTPLQTFTVGTVAQDGSFVVSNVLPGRYTVNVAALPGFPTLKSIVLGGQDITDTALDVGGKDLTELVMTFVDTPTATLTITTPMPPPGQSMEDVVAFVFPADRRSWSDSFGVRRRFRQQTMSPKGVANLTGMAGGDYLVAIVSSAEVNSWPDPAYLEVLSRRAQRVTLTDGGKQTVEVRR